MYAVGAEVVIDPCATVLASISANASFTEHPILYYSINTTSFDSSVTYDSGAAAGK